MQKVTVPEGKSGNWEVEKFTVSEMDSAWAIFQYKERRPYPGDYTRLMCNERTIMSDTPAEVRDHAEPVHKAKGHILINGLGLGVVLLNSLLKPEVEKATVIELSPDVIKLVGPHYQDMFGDRLEIINDDAFTFKPPKNIKYGMVWHDIWPSISTDNNEDMSTLHRRYGRKAEWQGSWGRYEIKRMLREERNHRNSWGGGFWW